MSKKRLNAQKSAFKLAEGATGVNLLSTKAKGFTLAEVLITLGIIGVVAAMTIPTLIANTRSQQYRSQFKKTLSTLNQAARMAQAQYDFDFSNMDTFPNYDDNPANTKSITALINGTIAGGNWNQSGAFIENRGMVLDKYFNSNTNICASTGFVIDLPDGSSFTACADNYMNCNANNPCLGIIDVNGYNNKPNKEIKCQNNDDTEYLFEPAYSVTEQHCSHCLPVTTNFPASFKNSVCTVNNSSIGDTFPVYFHDEIIRPATNAAAYVLNTAK